MAKDVIYTTGVIAVKENKLLGDRLFKLCDGTAEEAFRTVTESGFGRGAEVESVAEYEKLLAFDEDETDAFIREYAPTNAEREYLLTPRDYHNAKALFKAKHLGVSAQNMLAPEGLVSIETLSNCIKERDYSPLDEGLRKTLEQAEELFPEEGNQPSGVEIGVIFDKALYKRLFEKCSSNRFLKKQLTAKADMNNILICLRSESFEFAEMNLFEGGKVSKSALEKIFSENAETAEHALDGTDYAGFYAGCLNARRAGRPMTEGERVLESFETQSLKSKKYELTKAQPFLYYIFRRRAENANLRILFVCLSAGMDERDIKARLRTF